MFMACRVLAIRKELFLNFVFTTVDCDVFDRAWHSFVITKPSLFRHDHKHKPLAAILIKMTPFKRKYLAQDLNPCALIRLRFATAGLDNPVGDFLESSNACEICNAGRELKENLNIPTNRMGKKRIDRNERYGFIIIEGELARELLDNGLAGFDCHQVKLGKNDSTYKLMRIQQTLPWMTKDSAIQEQDICERCGRSGHYDNYEIETRFTYNYSDIKNLNGDFFVTWEHFGIWKMGQTHSEIVISQKAYRVLSSLKLRHLKFDPIDISQ